MQTALPRGRERRDWNRARSLKRNRHLINRRSTRWVYVRERDKPGLSGVGSDEFQIVHPLLPHLGRLLTENELRVRFDRHSGCWWFGCVANDRRKCSPRSWPSCYISLVPSSTTPPRPTNPQGSRTTVHSNNSALSASIAG